MKEGDRNMKYVHQKAATRAKKNNIKRLAANDGQTSRDKKVMQAMATNFFKGLYTADTGANPGEVVNLYQSIISGEMNTNLCKEFPGKEISDALFHIGPLKEPDPHGFPARFFQRNWEVVKGDVQNYLQSGVNEITIVLLPKKEGLEFLKDFRPISLCNVIYKVVSKCLVNRLRSLLHELIGPMQSAFILGRLITDNMLIAFECLHAIEQGTVHVGSMEH
jgi:hypothetical protein